MICSKGQLVRLTRDACSVHVDVRKAPHDGTARVVSLVYLDQPEGTRGVQLDRPLGGSGWWLESYLEEAT